VAWWTIQSLVVASALALVVQVVARIGRLGPVARHALWVIVLIKLLTPPFVAWPWAVEAPAEGLAWLRDALDADAQFPAVPRAHLASAPLAPLSAALLPLPATSDRRVVTPLETADPVAPPARDVVVSGDPSSAPRVWMPSWIVLGAAVWIGGALLMVLVHGVRIWRMSRMVRRSMPADDALVERIERHARALGLHAIDVRRVAGLDSPVVWAFRRARLLWPADLSLDRHSTDGLIVHELAHVKRRDHVIGWLELMAGAIWWWNPLFWYVRHQIRENAELSCDAWVVDTLPGGRRAYAEALLAVCALASRRAMPLPAVGVRSSGRRFLERRLTVIMRDRVPLRLPRFGLVCLLFLAAAAVPTLAQQQNRILPVRVEPSTAGTARAVPGTGVAFVPVIPRPDQSTTTREAPATAARESDLAKVTETFAQNQAAAVRDAEARIARYRQETIQQLQAMQDAHTRAGRLDEAIAVRDYIRQLQRQAESAPAADADTVLVDPERRQVTTISHQSILPNPGDLTRFRDRIGQTFFVSLTAGVVGSVWGSDIYTDDSTLSVAAVHAGVLQPGETGIVRVTMLPGRTHYTGTLRNGVRTDEYEQWGGSYRVTSATGPAPVIDMRESPDIGVAYSVESRRLASFLPASVRGRVGASVTMDVTGRADGPVWGTDVYTDDSSVAAAAVHAGLLKVGERGRIKVTMLPGQDSYPGTTRNGVTSAEWASWDGSFKLELVGRR